MVTSNGQGTKINWS